MTKKMLYLSLIIALVVIVGMSINWPSCPEVQCHQGSYYLVEDSQMIELVPPCVWNTP